MVRRSQSIGVHRRLRCGDAASGLSSSGERFQARREMTRFRIGSSHFLVSAKVQKLETGNWKLETGNWKLETGNWKLETGNWKLENERPAIERLDRPVDFRDGQHVELQLSFRSAAMTTDLILGTAGHIDHGKTSLVRALTGVNTDRLPEERKRGITIDLGFAELLLPPYRLGIVDVPGHERFVRNMLAGATGIDVAMLVVAADDSVKPQTREHFEILRLLGLPAGVIALTKVDLVDQDWLPLVEEDIRELVRGSFLERAPIVPTSSSTGQGLPELRVAIAEAAALADAERKILTEAPFRLAIDRHFSATGHGTIVTGSIGSGRIAVGDQLVVEPGNVSVRVRGIQNHDRSVEGASRGQRAAINLVGVKASEIGRGQELAAIGHLRPTRTLTVRLNALVENPKPIKNRQRVRLHIGSAEYMANLLLLEGPQLGAGESSVAQLLLSEPAVAIWKQPFVLRSESPVTTIGGGLVLSPDAAKIRRPDSLDLEMINDLDSESPQRRAEVSAFLASWEGWDANSLTRNAGIVDSDEAKRALLESGKVISIPLTNSRDLLVHEEVLKRLGDQIIKNLSRQHDEHPLALGFEESGLEHRFSYVEPNVLRVTVRRLVADKTVRRLGRSRVGLSDRGPRLSSNERKVYEQLVEFLKEGGIEPPFLPELVAQVKKNRESVPSLLEIAEAQGDVVTVADSFFLHTEVDERIQKKLGRAAAEHPNGMTLSEIRNIMETSRKYAVPYCEYLDRIGVTVRDGDVRRFPGRTASVSTTENSF
jgi:selenocysteine-specific elongation factor